MTDAARAAAVSCQGLWKVFGPRADRIVGSAEGELSRDELLDRTGCVAAVRDVSFEVAPGEFFVLMGLSGSGKSTLIRCLSRLIEPTAGTVAIDGVDVTAANTATLRELRRHTVSMVFQHFGLLPNRRVVDNVAYGLEIAGTDRRVRHERAHELIELVGLHGFAESYPDELSGGMKQRVGLARALATDPTVLLLDEPFSALDPLIRADMQEELCRLQRELGKTMVFITHDLREALRLGDRVGVMREGEIVQIGTAAELLDAPADDYVRDFTRDVPRALVLTAADVAVPREAVVIDAEDGPVPVTAGTVLRDVIPAVAGGRVVEVVDAGHATLGYVDRDRVLAAIYGGTLDERAGAAAAGGDGAGAGAGDTGAPTAQTR